MSDRIIFLDYDGVVNNYLWGKYYSEYCDEPYFHCAYAFPKDNFVNNKQALYWLNALYECYPYDIVVTSTWREYPNYKECLYNGGLNSKIKIIDKIDSGNDREGLILKWVKDNNFNGTYVVLDDEAYLYFKKIDKDKIIITDDRIGINHEIIGEIIGSFKKQEMAEDEYLCYLDDLAYKYDSFIF